MLPLEAIAEAVKTSWRYTLFIFLDSCSQSRRESWIIHKESIHKNRIPNSRVGIMASLKLAGRLLYGILPWNDSRVSVVRSGVTDPP